MEHDDRPISPNHGVADKAVWLDLVRSIREFAGSGIWLTIGIVAAASLVEGFGLVMLFPIASLIFAKQSDDGGYSAEISNVLNSLGIETMSGQLAILGTGFIVWMGLRGALLLIRDRRLALLSGGYVDQLRLQMFGSIAHAPWPTVRRLAKSDLITMLTTDISRIGVAIQFIFTVLITVTLSTAYLIVGYLISPVIGLSLLGLTGLAILVGLLWSRRSSMLGRSVTGKNKRAMFAMTRFLDGLKSAKAFGAEKVFIADFGNVVAEQRNLQVAFVMQQGKLRRSIEFLAAFAAVGLLLFGGAVLGIAGAELLLLGAVIVRLAPSLLQTLTGFQSLAFAMPAFAASQEQRRQIEKHSGQRPVLAPAHEPAFDPSAPEAIRLQDVVVSVHEHGEKLDLLHVQDIHLPAKGLIHLSGPSGAGKSTFAELLAGLYLPAQGTVRAGQMPLNADNQAAWQRRISFAQQEPFLFNGSIRENLSWPNTDMSEDDIWGALDLAEAGELVRSLPGGLDLQLRDGGNRLSGGERQRLCLARALLRPSALLIIDEGLSAVQDNLEMRILGKLKELAGDKLIVCVSHSQASEAMADSIIDISQKGVAAVRLS